ncbi:DUF4188 domain-containing protein [Inhella gelatinilytica]|uniref:DUF4188 domain-containing protein n=1 Tax=Inhella gelatinilytica TaxID=2795030 RepID=UPI0028731358|nr:DUF4188 domain-containing protein [Inhella gelatinilytica]
MAATPDLISTPPDRHSKAIRFGRLTAQPEGEFVVFLIGMRANQLWRVDRWLPVATAMPRMLKELALQRDYGFLHGEMWFGRTTLMLQYWKSVDALMAYARNRQAAHLPAWADFNRRVGRDGAVGIWHETYVIQPGRTESIYVNMPPFGAGCIAPLRPAVGPLAGARERMAAAPLDPA